MLSQIIKAIAVNKGVNPFADDKRVKPNVAVRKPNVKPDAYKSINSSSIKL
jgi:hypothetical protein